MTYVNKEAFLYLQERYNQIQVIDVGAARASFMKELLGVYERKDDYSIGIDPINHHTTAKPRGPIVDKTQDHYDLFMQCGGDNVGKITSRTFYINSDDQTSSFSKLKLENLSTDRSDKTKYWYSQGAIDRIRNVAHVVEDVPVYPLQEVIKQHLGYPTNLIHFIKIDAEGKDLDVIKSIEDKTLRRRVKFITIECPNRIPRFEGESTKPECINYMQSKNFKIFTDMDYEDDPCNGEPMSDVVFINGEDI